MGHSTDVTPAEAKTVWDSLEKPSARKVSQILAAHGRKVSFQTVAVWHKAGWPPVAATVRDALDDSIASVIGKPNASVCDLPAIAPLAPDLPLAQALEETCRDGLNAARTVFRLVEAHPSIIATAPANVGIMLEKTGALVARLAESLGGCDAIVERGMKDVSTPHGRTRQNDPLAESIELWEKYRQPPQRIP
jgi:hypothetical protein